VHLKKLGRYELVSVLGKGAMGVVYEGRDPNLDRRVAIKTIMVDGLSPDAAAEYESRFRTEARSAARLQHPNIVTVYDSDRDGDIAFLVMEFVQGEDLKHHLDRGQRYGVPEALRLVQDLLSALDYAHRQGIVHRDVKPANLLMEPGGRLKLTDFGVARITGEATRTQGSMIGTLKYMAPEQVQGQKVDARADLFSAGIVTYQLLTGVRPFDGDNDFSIIHQVIGHTPPAPSTVVPGLPPAFDAVIAKAMAKQREARFATAGEFAMALEQAFAGVELPPAVLHPPTRSPVTPVSTVRSETIPGAPITHELELEYWRAVRDTTDRSDLDGFLARFPEGIYADLARRRLHRLAAVPDPEQTVLRGMTLPGTASVIAPAQPDAEATDTTTFAPTVPVERDPVALPPGNAWSTAADAPDARSAPTQPPAPAPTAARATGGDARAKAGAKVKARSASPAAPAPRGRKPLLAGAAALAVVVGVATALFAMRQQAAPDGSAVAASAATVAAAAPASAPAAGASEPAVVAVTTAAAPVAVSAAPPAAAASVPASAPRAAASAARPVRRAASAVQAAATPAAAAAAAPQPPARPEASSGAAVAGAAPDPVAAGGQRLVPPSVTCKDRSFLMKEFCLQTECAKPGYASFPACIKLREDAKLREGSRIAPN
jgi:serine/threonine-protein kinase